MRWNTLRTLGLFSVLLLALTGCGDGGSGTTLQSNAALHETDSGVRSLAVRDGFAGAVLREGALEILDVSDPLTPRLLARFSAGPEAKVAMLDGFLYLLEETELRRFDLSAAGGPVERASVPLRAADGYGAVMSRSLAPGSERVFALYGLYTGPGPPSVLFYAIGPEGDATPFHAGGFFDFMTDILAAEPNRLYTRHRDELFVINIEAPLAASETRPDYSLRITRNPQVMPLDIQYDPATHRMLEVIQKVEEAEGLPLFFVVYENPAEPIQGEFPESVDAVEMARLPFTGGVDRGFTVYAKAMAVDGDRAYVALINGEIAVFDVTQSETPFQLDTLDTGLPDPADITELRQREMRIADGHLFIGSEQGLIVLELPEYAPRTS